MRIALDVWGDVLDTADVWVHGTLVSFDESGTQAVAEALRKAAETLEALKPSQAELDRRAGA